MVSTFTPNLQIEEPARGDQVGTWDTPVNNNMTLFDNVLGNVTTIALNNSNVVLSAAQFQSKTIVFNSTLTASVTITFPTSFVKSYEIYNTCTGTSAFTITLNTTAATRVICAPPGEAIDVVNIAGNITYKNLGHVGSYWDHGGSSVPNWVSGCTVPPYLNCDGTAFSSATYPLLASFLGGTNLPDSRGRFRAMLNQATGRITATASNGGVDGNTLLAAGGVTSVTIATSNLPPYTPAGSVTIASINSLGFTLSLGGTVVLVPPVTGGSLFASSGTFTGTAQGGASVPMPTVPPTYIGGITMIRSA